MGLVHNVPHHNIPQFTANLAQTIIVKITCLKKSRKMPVIQHILNQLQVNTLS